MASVNDSLYPLGDIAFIYFIISFMMIRYGLSQIPLKLLTASYTLV
jgi:hypothetical protein